MEGGETALTGVWRVLGAGVEDSTVRQVRENLRQGSFASGSPNQ